MQTDSGPKGMGRRHALILLLCCLLSVAAIAAIWVSGISLNGALLFAMVLLCPVGHLLMMRGGHQHH